MNENQLINNATNDSLELILCKISSAICETERISENFNELKRRYSTALKQLNTALEINKLLTKKIDDLRCREAALMGQLRLNTVSFGEDEMDDQIIN